MRVTEGTPYLSSPEQETADPRFEVPMGRRRHGLEPVCPPAPTRESIVAVDRAQEV